MQRFTYKALMDFSATKAKSHCAKCSVIFLVGENGGKCPECNGDGVPIMTGLDFADEPSK